MDHHSRREVELSFYDAIPPGRLSYESFKHYAVCRLKVLQEVEKRVPGSTFRHTKVSTQKDRLEHACMQIICSQDAWLCRFFANNEAALFRLRLETVPEAIHTFFIKKVWPHLYFPNPANCKVISKEVFFDPEHANKAPYSSEILVHFTKCSDVITRREYEMEEGYLRLSQTVVLKSYIVAELKRTILQRMERVSGVVKKWEDDRFQRLRAELFTKSIDKTKSPDALSRSDKFPLCIRGIIDKLKKDMHLKFDDRQTLCRFFKDIGMPLDVTINYFRSNFKCSPDEFNKDYLYAIRHNYGLEGRRADYTSYPCNKLIGLTSNPNAFGCPFVKNHKYVKVNVDIEDLGGDAKSLCGKVGGIIAGSPLESAFDTPAEYFRLIVNASKNQNK